MSTKELTESRTVQLVRLLINSGLDGVGPLVSSRELAHEYEADTAYDCLDDRVDSLIRVEASKSFGSGFVAGLGGLVTLPVMMPAGLMASWAIQARMCGAIATLYGHDVRQDRVQTMVLLSIIGSAGKNVLKGAGVRASEEITLSMIDRLSGRALVDVNRRAGVQLAARTGEKGFFNLTKMVPIVGGVVGGTFDATSCVIVGKVAKRSFRPKDPAHAHGPEGEGECSDCAFSAAS